MTIHKSSDYKYKNRIKCAYDISEKYVKRPST